MLCKCFFNHIYFISNFLFSLYSLRMFLTRRNVLRNFRQTWWFSAALRSASPGSTYCHGKRQATTDSFLGILFCTFLGNPCQKAFLDRFPFFLGSCRYYFAFFFLPLSVGEEGCIPNALNASSMFPVIFNAGPFGVALFLRPSSTT